MTKKIYAKIVYGLKGSNQKFVFDDTYIIDPTYFWGNDDILQYIKNDLLLCAGGGYSTKAVKNAKFVITGGGFNIDETRPKNNRIPRQFNRITARQLIDLSSGKKGDLYHIYRNDAGLTALNVNTGKYYNLPFATARNINVFEFIETV